MLHNKPNELCHAPEATKSSINNTVTIIKKDDAQLKAKEIYCSGDLYSCPEYKKIANNELNLIKCNVIEECQNKSEFVEDKSCNDSSQASDIDNNNSSAIKNAINLANFDKSKCLDHMYIGNIKCNDLQKDKEFCEEGKIVNNIHSKASLPLEVENIPVMKPLCIKNEESKKEDSLGTSVVSTPEVVISLPESQNVVLISEKVQNNNTCKSVGNSGAVPKLRQNGQKRSSSDGAAKAIEDADPICEGTSLNKKHSSSEYDVRAASVRAKLEEKLEQIEKELNVQKQNALDDSNFQSDADCVSEIVQELIQTRRTRSCSLIEMKETAIARLQLELDKAQKELKLKDEEVSKLSKIRDEVGAEIEDLTASLFEEANNMVREANIKQALAEKRAKEANMKLTILQEEVKALKSLVQATVPCIPSYILPLAEHPHNNQSSNKKTIFRKSQIHNKSPSCTDLPNQAKYELSPVDSVSPGFQREQYEVDPIPHQEFVSWRQNPQIDKTHPFLKRIYVEDIIPCMNFENKELAEKVLCAIEENKIIIESVSSKNPLPKKCALLEIPRFCKYRMNFGDGNDWQYISVLCRNRIAAVCDFFCYLKYIEKGLIKHSIHEVFLEVLKKRKRMIVARIGLPDADL